MAGFHFRELGEYREVFYREKRENSLPPGAGTSFRESNRDRVNRRAKGNIKRLVLSQGLRYMWSLTYAENMCDSERGWADFRKFTRRLRKEFPFCKWLVVLEYQDRGAVHFHFVTDCWFPHDLITRLWDRGFVFVSDFGEDLMKCAGYLGKYLSKNFSVGMRYTRSRNMEYIEVSGEADSLEEVIEAVESRYGAMDLVTCGIDGSRRWFWGIFLRREVLSDGDSKWCCSSGSS